jgi:hypothetical protein
MTINDGWLLERAQKAKAAALQAAKSGSPVLKTLPPVDGLWKQLQEETKRQAGVYTGAVGDPGAVVVDTPPDLIDVRVPDGRQLTLRVDRERRRLSETFRTQAGAIRMRKPIIRFSLDAAGQLTFNFGGLQAAASSLLRRLID